MTSAHVSSLPAHDQESLRLGAWTRAATEARLRDGYPVMSMGQLSPQATRWLSAQKKKGNLEQVAAWGLGSRNRPVYRMKDVPLADGEAERLSRFPYALASISAYPGGM